MFLCQASCLVLAETDPLCGALGLSPGLLVGGPPPSRHGPASLKFQESVLSEAGHFLLFLLEETNSVTGYPLLCFHVIRGREKNKRGPAPEKWRGGHLQAGGKPVNSLLRVIVEPVFPELKR